MQFINIVLQYFVYNKFSLKDLNPFTSDLPMLLKARHYIGYPYSCGISFILQFKIKSPLYSVYLTDYYINLGKFT